MKKKWELKKYDAMAVEALSKRYKISTLFAKLLYARNVAIDDVESYINPTLDKLRDPYILKDMDKLVYRIKKAHENNEKVTVYGDYDVDGVTSINILMSFLKELGLEVDYYLPERLEEGYGLNKEALKKVKNTGTSLVITVDCGISAYDEVEYAKSIGLDICITDHHECPAEMPKAYAIVNAKRKDSKYPFRMFAGVGMAFKVISALAKEYNLPKERYLKYLDMAAVGTISDIVPLVDENRIISRFGVESVKDTHNLGLRALIKVAGYKSVDSTMISFGLAPRINACGRMGNSSLAVKLLLASNINDANNIARQLEKQNKERQAVEKEIYDEAVNIIEKDEMNKNKVIVLGHEGWHHGVIGIVASKLTELYVKPVILLTFEGEMAKGSGRTPRGFSLYDALNECKEYLVQFGGHELAAGITLKKKDYNKFKQKFEEVAEGRITTEFEKIIEIDAEITKDDLIKQTFIDIDKLKPFGQENPEPIFIYKNLKVCTISTVGQEKHLKLVVGDEKLIDCVGFGQGYRRDELVVGDKIDVVCTIGINYFGMLKKVQLNIKDFSKSV